MIRISVDLPEPLAPMTPKISPRRIWNPTRSTTRRAGSLFPLRFQGSKRPKSKPPPKDFETPDARNGNSSFTACSVCGRTIAGSGLSYRVATVIALCPSEISSESEGNKKPTTLCSA